MADCPRCFEPLADPNACRCGWKARVRAKETDKPPRARVPCAHMMCEEEARIRKLLPTGWANLCFTHHDAMHAEQAARRMTEFGLDRKAGEDERLWRKRVMAYLKANSAFKRFEDAEDDRGAQALEDEWSRTA